MSDNLPPLDRSDAVNLARNMLDVRDFKEISVHGVRVLCEAVMKMDAAIEASRAAVPAGWVPLSDSQWLNIVNADNAWYGYEKSEAILEVVKLVEASLKLNNSSAPQPVAQPGEQPRLTVRLTAFPESNGKRNWTALLVRVNPWGGLIGNCGGITIDRGEMWNRVAYEAECARFLIGERDTEPHIRDYGDDIETPEEWNGETRGGRPARKVPQARSEQASQQWMPIETAPKDLVILLGYEPQPRLEGSRRVYEGRWHEATNKWGSVNGFIVHDEATHWMDLPAPPKPKD